MALIDTTNTIDTSIHLKAKLSNNMVGDNWYLENLQEKRNQDWEYRYNVINIEEELNKQINYTTEMPCYTPIDAVIQTVKSDRGKPLGDDWASLAFRDLSHPNNIGFRYRFDFTYDGEGMQDLSSMSEEEKYYNTSVWLAVNKSSISAGNALVVRRCNTSVALVGSPTRDYKNITEVRYEPAVLENELKLINIYYNQTTVIPQAEWYMTMQLNYFTNFIKINDRMIIGGVDTEDESNNTLFKVKAIVKANSNRTFSKFGSYDLENIPLIILGLDRDLAGEDDDFYKRIAVQSPIYPVQSIPVEDNIPEGEYVIDINSPEDNLILLGNTIEKQVFLIDSDGKKEYGKIDSISMELLGVPKEEQMKYYTWEYLFRKDIYNNDTNEIIGFKIKNLKKYDDNYLVVTCNIKANIETRITDIQIYESKFYFELGGFY